MGRAEQLRGMSPQLIAEVTLYATADGGRKSTAFPGWGCPCCASRQEPIVGYDGWPLLGDSPANSAAWDLFSYPARKRLSLCGRQGHSTFGKAAALVKRRSCSPRAYTVTMQLPGGHELTVRILPEVEDERGLAAVAEGRCNEVLCRRLRIARRRSAGRLAAPGARRRIVTASANSVPLACSRAARCQ